MNKKLFTAFLFILFVLMLFIFFSRWVSIQPLIKDKILFAYVPTAIRDYPSIKGKPTNTLLVLDIKGKKTLLKLPSKNETVISANLSPDRTKIIVTTYSSPPLFHSNNLFMKYWTNLWLYNVRKNKWVLLWKTPDSFMARWLYTSQHILIDSQLDNREEYPRDIYQFKEAWESASYFNKIRNDQIFILNLKGEKVASYNPGAIFAGSIYLDPSNPYKIHFFTYARDTKRIEENHWAYESPLDDWDYTFIKKSFEELDWKQGKNKILYIFPSSGLSNDISPVDLVKTKGFLMGPYFPVFSKTNAGKTQNYCFDTILNHVSIYYSLAARRSNASGMDPISLNGRYIVLTPNTDSPVPLVLYDTHKKKYHHITENDSNYKFEQAGFDEDNFYCWKEILLPQEIKTIELKKDNQYWVRNKQYHGLYVQFYKVNLQMESPTEPFIGTWLFTD